MIFETPSWRYCQLQSANVSAMLEDSRVSNTYVACGSSLLGVGGIMFGMAPKQFELRFESESVDRVGVIIGRIECRGKKGKGEGSCDLGGEPLKTGGLWRVRYL